MRKRASSWLVSAVVAITALGVGCSRTAPGPDPAAANVAPADQYGQPPIASGAAATTYPAGYTPLDVAPTPPPALPEYSQPECPGPNHIWTPGYWGYSQAGYYWVPGAWVTAPYAGALWTPPYWAYGNGHYDWHPGYWGRHIGFYGGINYGFGYAGFGYDGGYWNNGAFYYNSAANRVNTRIVHNVYDRPVTNYTPYNRVAYNGGPGGIERRPQAAELAAQHEEHTRPLPAQVEHARTALSDRGQFAAQNHGRPATVAAARPLTPGNAPAARTPAPNSAPVARTGAAQAAPQRFGRGEAPVAREAGPYVPRAMQSARPQPAPANSADRRMPEERQPQPAPRRAAPAEQRPSPFEGRGAAPQQPHPQAQARQAGPPAGQRPAAAGEMHAPPQQAHPEPVRTPAQPEPRAAAPQPRPAPAAPHVEPAPRSAPRNDEHEGRGGR